MPCIDLTLTNPNAKQAIQNRLDKIKGINADLRERLRRQIKLGFEHGESIDEIADRIQKTFRAERARSLTIARTEINGSASDGLNIQAHKEFGTHYEKEWISSRDGRVRDSHYAVDGQRIQASGLFSNGLSRPHQPGAPAKEVINCRCVLLIHPTT